MLDSHGPVLAEEDRAGVRVLVCADQYVGRLGLRHVLEEREVASVVGEIDRAGGAADAAREASPDVTLFDVSAGLAQLRESVRAISSGVEGTSTEVVTLVDAGDIERARAALRAGARGIVSRGKVADHLVRAVTTVVGGEAFVSASMIRALLDTWSDQAMPVTGAVSPSALDDLTPREGHVLRHMADGASNGEIARRLVLSETTIKSHVRRVLRKLAARDRAQAVAIAHKNGIAVVGRPPRSPLPE